MVSSEELENKIDYHFKNKNFLRLALTHSSYANEHHMKKTAYNERIEFLGDAVLELSSSDYLYKNFPDVLEGKLTSLRAKLVCEDSLAMSAREINLGKYIILGKGEKQSHGEKRNSILSDAFEALIGAIYLDGGFDVAYDFVKKYVLNDIDNRTKMIDSKTSLQEIAQAEFGIGATYKVVEESGPEHDKHFKVVAYIGDKEYATGEGNSKKNATKDAAYKTIKTLEKIGVGGSDVSKKH